MAKTKTTKQTKTSAKGALGLTPTAGYIIIEPQDITRQTNSGIYLPDNASGDKPQKGTVLAVGPDEVTEHGVKKSSPVKAGDIVIYKKWGGSEVKIEGKEYLFSKFEDILAIEN
jgi:chaperonin GroES